MTPERPTDPLLTDTLFTDPRLLTDRAGRARPGRRGVRESAAGPGRGQRVGTASDSDRVWMRSAAPGRA